MPLGENKTASVYEKMPLWQWVIIYLIVGIIIYGLFYSFIMLKQNNSQNPPQDLSEGTMRGEERVEVNTDLETAEIELTEEGFVPDMVTVNAGTTVTWTNNSGAVATVDSDDHPTHEAYPPLNLGEFIMGGTLMLKFDTVGVYTYHNDQNPDQKGTIEVVEKYVDETGDNRVTPEGE